MLFLFLLRRFGGRPMLSGLLLMVCGIALVAIWALSGGGRGAVQLVRYGILCALAGAVLVVRTAYRGRRKPRAAPPGD
jgi:nitrate/nitrite transporter NarK